MFESKINRGRANGYAPLDSGSKVPLSYLPPIQSTIDTGSLVTIGQTGSFATTSSLQTLINATGSYATTGSNTFIGTQTINGNIVLNSSVSNWGNGFTSLQLGSKTSIWNSDINFSTFGNNLYYDGSQYRYLTNGVASKFEHGNGVFTWVGATTGNTGDTVSFYNEFMRLDTTGNLGIATTSAGSKLQVNGNVAIGYSDATAAPTNGLIVNGDVIAAGNIYANNLIGLATTGSNSFNGNQIITGSLTVTSTTVNNSFLYATESDLVIDSGSLNVIGGGIFGEINATNGVISSSQQIIDYGFVTTSSYNSDSSSFDYRIENINSVVTQGVPMGTISGSQQISDLGFITSSQTIDTTSFATTGSNFFNGNQTITGSILATNNIQTTNGYVQTPLLYNPGAIEIRSYYQALQINSNGAGVIINDNVQISGSLNVSASIQGLIAATNGVISGSSQLTSSFDIRYTLSGSVQNATLPAGTISSSAQITAYGFITSSTIPTGTISSSAQITAYGFASGSFETTGRGIISGSSQITPLLPTGIISSSTQLNNLGYATTSSLQSLSSSFNTFTSSYLTDSASAATSRNTNSASIALLSSQTSSYETTGRGIISSSTQIIGLGFTTTSSFNLYTASISTASLVSSISNLNLYTSSASTLSGNNTFTGTNVFSGSTYFSGSVIFEDTREVIVLDTNFGLGTRNFDYTGGTTFYLNNLTGSGTWNIQNFVSSSQRATPLTFIIEQGATAYSASVYQLGGTAVSVKWQNGVIPVGTPNKTDAFGLVVFRSGSTFNVLGSYSTFG